MNERRLINIPGYIWLAANILYNENKQWKGANSEKLNSEDGFFSTV